MTDLIDRNPDSESDDVFSSFLDQIKNAKEQPPMLQFEKAEDTKKRYKSREYKLACFIMGCLIQEEVVTTDDHNDVGCSDMVVGIDIIAACLEGNLAEGFATLPFDW